MLLKVVGKMSSMHRMSDLHSVEGLEGVVLTPPLLGVHSATVIFLHGLGDSGNGLADLAQLWSQRLPHLKFILPTAKSIPVTLNMGHVMPAWYDIKSLDDREKENSCHGIEESRAIIYQLLEQEIYAGVNPQRIILGGFSQGAALSLYTGLQLPYEIGNSLKLTSPPTYLTLINVSFRRNYFAVGLSPKVVIVQAFLHDNSRFTLSRLKGCCH